MTLKKLIESKIESKQVGIIYHFTKCANIKSILKTFTLYSINGYISTSRNFNLADGLGDISKKYGYVIRLNLDGNILSSKYKILPIAGLDDNLDPLDSRNKNRIQRNSLESEELIKADNVNIKKSLLSITVSGDKKCYEFLKNNYNIKVTYERKFKPIKENINFSLDENLMILYK